MKGIVQRLVDPYQYNGSGGATYLPSLPKWSAWVPVVLLLVLVWKLTLTVTEESILVLRSCGLQVKTTYLIGRSATQFVDMAQVKDIVINEGIRMHQVICYLSVLLTPRPGSDENGLFPLFMNSLPKVGVLREIYGGVKPLLVRRGD
ncbi:phosphatidylinositol N-acetylglucosaminyltransferase subunit H-like [Liolophura sinensis]|uniref:phosphatidylinositol N-acetylglucosaminyltransferase subunit H-like n=1 Tax=Liolophura sinensis TaxID=3198878 RepID=UPI0031595BA8